MAAGNRDEGEVQERSARGPCGVVGAAEGGVLTHAGVVQGAATAVRAAASAAPATSGTTAAASAHSGTRSSNSRFRPPPGAQLRSNLEFQPISTPTFDPRRPATHPSPPSLPPPSAPAGMDTCWTWVKAPKCAMTATRRLRRKSSWWGLLLSLPSAVCVGPLPTTPPTPFVSQVRNSSTFLALTVQKVSKRLLGQPWPRCLLWRRRMQLRHVVRGRRLCLPELHSGARGVRQQESFRGERGR